jgi:hypothetical protein
MRIKHRDVSRRALNVIERRAYLGGEENASSRQSRSALRIAVVIPCYRVREQVLDVIRRIPSNVSLIVCVDDQCPDGSGRWLTEECRDPRVRVITHEENQGVGGAMVTGYQAALAAGADVVIKVDGDGQMDPALIPRFIQPIADGIADYAKGNRFYRPESLHSMPLVRLVGNALLSFVAKASTGYWRVFDPTNGYTAIHATALRLIPLEKISRRYFFETDMLYRARRRLRRAYGCRVRRRAKQSVSTTRHVVLRQRTRDQLHEALRLHVSPARLQRRLGARPRRTAFNGRRHSVRLAPLDAKHSDGGAGVVRHRDARGSSDGRGISGAACRPELRHFERTIAAAPAARSRRSPTRRRPEQSNFLTQLHPPCSPSHRSSCATANKRSATSTWPSRCLSRSRRIDATL